MDMFKVNYKLHPNNCKFGFRSAASWKQHGSGEDGGWVACSLKDSHQMSESVGGGGVF